MKNGKTTPARIVPQPTADSGDEENLLGWGFSDTRFEVQPSGAVTLTGSRYDLCGTEMPGLLPWMARALASPVNAQDQLTPNPAPPVAPPREGGAFLIEISAALEPDQITADGPTRLRHGHGHTGVEIHALLYGRIPRLPDLVVYPASDAQVAALVVAANRHGVVLIPYGGGTNVTRALECPEDEQRLIVSVDMARMNRILWIDKENGLAKIQAGAPGRSIMAQLSHHGLTMGHEPDSVEFSTMGGWVATNCSGMKRNRYGNIEDIVVDLTAVTSLGVVERFSATPRESAGMDARRYLFGSEGTLGIITSVTVKVQRMPAVQRFASVLFPDFGTGFAFLREVERERLVPTSIRLMDHAQFEFGMALKGTPTWWERKKNALSKLLVTKVKGIDLDKCTLATVVFEGTQREVATQEAGVAALARRFGGVMAGPENGRRGYNLTFGIAYLRDLMFRHHIIAESFETSVSWSGALEMCTRVEARSVQKHRELGLPGKPFMSMRITQLYVTGVCIYFYLGFYAKGVDRPIEKYAALEDAIREEILACGGSLSHHHGVGKLRAHFLEQIQSAPMTLSHQRLKRALDPNDVFACRNQALAPSAASLPATKVPVGTGLPASRGQAGVRDAS